MTDQLALKAIETMSFPRPLSLRWLEIITNFNFKVEYQKASLHQDVDYLSRHSETKPNDEEGAGKTENNKLRTDDELL